MPNFLLTFFLVSRKLFYIKTKQNKNGDDGRMPSRLNRKCYLTSQEENRKNTKLVVNVN